jgi:uncharacterized protein YdaU (DUF1376 family)
LNFYERHIGDYTKDTSHLSLLEHGIYTRLMDVYYTRESAIPEDQTYRLISARTPAEKKATDSILKEFFTLIDGAWRQKRCEEVIDEHRAFIEKQRTAAAKRWHSGGNAPGMPPDMPAHSGGNANGIPPTTHYPLPTTHKTQNGSHEPVSKVQPSGGNKRKRPPPKSPLPESFSLDPELSAYVTAKIPDADPAAMFEAFCGAARAKGWQYVDWRQAWQTYVRNCAPNSGHWAAGQYPRAGAGAVRWM